MCYTYQNNTFLTEIFCYSSDIFHHKFISFYQVVKKSSIPSVCVDFNIPYMVV